jgi:lysophospholipase L1-like esterase
MKSNNTSVNAACAVEMIPCMVSILPKVRRLSPHLRAAVHLAAPASEGTTSGRGGGIGDNPRSETATAGWPGEGRRQVAILAAGRKIAPAAILGNLLALGAGLLVMLLLGEIALRIVDLGHPYYSAPEMYRESADPRLLFEPRPNFDGFSEGVPVRTNSLGLRERELPPTRPAGTRRVVFLGDSVTFGAGVPDDQPFPRLLESAVNAAGAGPVETVNTGVVGYNTVQEQARLETAGLPYQPDVVVLTFVVNDMLETFSIFDHQYEPTGVLAGAKVWLRRNSNLYRFVQNVYWRVGQEMRRSREGPTEPLRKRDRLEERLTTLSQIVQTSRDRGASFLLVLYPDNLGDPVSPGPSGEKLTMREELERFASREQIPLVDLSEALGDVRDPRARQYRLREDPHPSPEGHRVIAEALRQPLLDVLGHR